MAPSAAPPSRPDPLRIRDAGAAECDALSALCLRSKAHWGYDAAFVKACAPYLRVTPDRATAGCSFVALDHLDRILGVAQIAPGETLHGSLDLLFIEPEAIGTGAGRVLFQEAAHRLREAGDSVMTILSDPDARGFYEKMGAVFIEDRPSDVFEGRKLPWLEYPL
ncbi:GNAT family N-acetyltransferase [Hyphobacterium sp.]|uniref:GNAT family N-acetyltransferase n=1 Tax=Hyphobacterium sp. TaxID=2004662 RepID=UPI003B51770D